ncbi:MAG: hypothetical protein LBS59_00690 [Puniceicoccales bacterium]|jgi:hypothetical protein|nr:hypothetical protein [Puniceicoccales bacterium]
MFFAFTITPELLAATLLTGGMACIFALWIFYERRDAAVYDTLARISAFHCVKCRHTYSAPSQPHVAPCPNCGFTNGYLKF